MLPVLPFLIGGALGAVAGVAFKKYYDEIQNSKGKNKMSDVAKEAVLEAIAKPRDIDQNLRKAQEARRDR